MGEKKSNKWKAVSIIGIIVPLFIGVYCWIGDTEESEDIKIKEENLEFAQKEMELIVSLVQNNTQTIMQLRYFLIVSLTALFGYAIKEDFFNKKKNKEKERDPKFFLLLGLFLTLFFFVTEATITSWQIAHMNRLSKLDNAINERILEDGEKIIEEKKLQEIFIGKEIDLRSKCNLIKNTIKTPTLCIFYFPLFILISLILWRYS